MSRLHDLNVLAQHYNGLFGPRGVLLLADRLTRRALPSVAYRPIQHFMWPAKDQRPRTKDQGSGTKDEQPQFTIRNAQLVLSLVLSRVEGPVEVSEIRNWFSSRFPNAVEQKTSAADQICDHVFDFLGTGPTHWGDAVDWHQDAKTGYHWTVKFYTDYGSDELMPGNGVDVKNPWELSRLHHFVTLAQAWWLTGEGRYTDEFFAQWESWLTADPWLYSINWTCAMEVAIRAVNLLWVRALLADAPSWTTPMNVPTFNVQRSTFERATIRSLRQHGLFIEHNLEVSARDGRIVAANHYLANMCGLACLGLCCPELPEADRWRRVGLKALEQEMQRQVLPDGFFFESSTSYHRLAVELFLIPALLARQCDHEMSGAYWQRLEQMMEVILYVTRPDGCVPQIGDNDDGRLLILSRYPDWPRHDHRYLLAIGAVLFERGDFKVAALRYGPLPPNPPLPTPGEGGTRLPSPTSPPELVLSPVEGLGGTEGGRDCPEEVFWLLGRDGVEQFETLKPDPTPLGSRAFPHAGLYVIRSQHNLDYALVRTSTKMEGGEWKGESGFLPSLFHSPFSILHLPSAHAHNDALSLELWVDGQPVFVDPGTYCYTSDLKARNRFRSTAAHNTVMVDGQEINRIRLDEPFRLERDARVRMLEWHVGDDEVRLVAEHDGYGRLASPVRHRRCVHYDAASRVWTVADELDGAGTHEAVWRWPGDAEDAMCVDRVEQIQMTTATAQMSVAIESPVFNWSHALEPSSYSPGYGRCKPADYLRVSVQFADRCSLSWGVRYQRQSTDLVPRPMHQRLNVTC